MSDLPKELSGIASELHHVAIVVRSISESRGAWEALGLSAGEPEFVEDQDVNVLICECGGQRIELVEPASPASPVSGFLEKRGPGLHHLAFKVADCAVAIEEARSRGLELIDHAPRPGSHGTTIAFLHPRATGGVLCELVQESQPAAG